VIGQPGFTTLTSNNTNGDGTLRSAKTLSTPRGMTFIGGKLYITDNANQRILVFDSVPTLNYSAASRVIGQIDGTLALFNSKSSIDATDVSTMRVYADSDLLIVPDSGRNRVLIWTTFPTSSNTPPNIVLGQADFSSGVAHRNSSTPTCASMNGPSSVFWDGARIYVGSESDHRVLVWNFGSLANLRAATGASGSEADYVLGQEDCATVTTSTTPGRLFSPRGVYVIGGVLFVSEQGSSPATRVSAFNVSLWPAPATPRVGITSVAFVIRWDTTSCASTTNIAISKPEQVFSDGTRFFIPERGNPGSSGSRLAVFSSIPTAATDCPSQIWGQATGTTSAPNQYIDQVGGGAFDADGALYMVDRGSNTRVEKWTSLRLPTETSQFVTPDAVWNLPTHDSVFGLALSWTYGGYGHTDSYTPALATIGGTELMVLGDRGGQRIYIVPKP
jgi:hypothetical protein